MSSIPMGPKEVFATIVENVDAEIRRINDKFKERRECAVETALPSVTLILTDYGLSFEERSKVAHAFEMKGWVTVTSRTSAENGERPGLISYTFSVA